MEKLFSEVCLILNMGSVLVKSKTKVRQIVMVRDAFMFIAYALDHQQKDIAEFLNVTASNVCRRIEQCDFEIANNTEYKSKIRSIINRHVPKMEKVKLDIKPEIAEWIKQNVNENLNEGFEHIFESWKSMMFSKEKI